jgi:hypothetical protein
LRYYLCDNSLLCISRVLCCPVLLLQFSVRYCRWRVLFVDWDLHWRILFCYAPILKFIKITSLVIEIITPTKALIISRAVLRRWGSVFIEKEPFIYYFISDNFERRIRGVSVGKWNRVWRRVIQSVSTSLPWCLTEVTVRLISRKRIS